MNLKTLLSILLFGLLVNTFSQNSTIELTFTAEKNGEYVPLNNILIENLTQGGDTTLYEPYSILVLDYVTNIVDNEVDKGNRIYLSQNHPNPFTNHTSIDLILPEQEKIQITVQDLIGNVQLNIERLLNLGKHSFTFYPGCQKQYLLSVRSGSQIQTIKLVSLNSSATSKVLLRYEGQNDLLINNKSQKAINGFVFNLGDELKFTAHADIGERTIIDAPTINQTYTFQYGGIPCPGMPSVTDIDGNTYKTVQIGDHCWMAENLKTTAYQNGTPIPNVTNNSIWGELLSGAYVWYDNDISWKDSYGAMYNWYATVDTNGICPTGWHMPSYDEWTVMTDFIGGMGYPHGNELKSCRQVNSPLGEGCNTNNHPRWDEDTTSNANYGLDDYGFSGLAGGYRWYGNGQFRNMGYSGFCWSSTETSYWYAWYRKLDYNVGFLYENISCKQDGFSVRCLRD